jgi:hypothetical protein
MASLYVLLLYFILKFHVKNFITFLRVESFLEFKTSNLTIGCRSMKFKKLSASEPYLVYGPLTIMIYSYGIIVIVEIQ